MIEFNDNQPCIELIESKLGILDLLDEESRLASGSDDSLISKLNSRFEKSNEFYEKPRFGNDAFIVKHYAANVKYSIMGFIDKNKDNISQEQLVSIIYCDSHLFSIKCTFNLVIGYAYGNQFRIFEERSGL
jgi:myosin V